MTTRAEWFRYAEQRAHLHEPPAGEQKQATASTGGHRPSRGRRASYALEESSGRPSRKSTRGSANRQKNDVQFRMKRREAEVRPRGE
jgi:hypothetical protein